MNQLPLWISGFSFALSIIAILISWRGLRLNHRAQVADKLKPYSDEFKKICAMLDPEIENLRKEAGEVFLTMQHRLVDKHAIGTVGGRPPRHLFFELCEGQGEKILKDLRKGVGIRASNRLGDLIGLQRNIDGMPDDCQEKGIMKALESVLPEKNQVELFQACVVRLAQYVKLHEELAPKLDETVEQIDRLYKKNEADLFHIQESDSLHLHMQRLRRKCEELRLLGMSEMPGLVEQQNLPFLSDCVFMATTLYVVERVNEWCLNSTIE